MQNTLIKIYNFNLRKAQVIKRSFYAKFMCMGLLTAEIQDQKVGREFTMVI